MKHVGIQQACSEDWSKMTPTEKGAFCQQCAKQVHDFTNKSNYEIKRTLLEMKNQPICMRMTVGQEITLNAEFEAWKQQNKNNFQHLFIAALIIVFGLTLFSCEDEKDRKKINDTQVALARIIEEPKEEKTPEEKSIFVPPPTLPLEIVNADPVLETDIVVQPEKNVKEPGSVTLIDYTIMGGGYSSRDFSTYLAEIIPGEINSGEIELDENGTPFPTEYKAIAFPNPTVENTTLEVQFPQKGQAEINLYDMSGKLIYPVYSGEVPRGTFRTPIELFDLNPGVYLAIIQSAEFKETVRILKN
ncbi:T9SS type A sorting domain-containing protein [Fluviicola sp.]|uniref:T9SS type A sorting domain-containing protein n=1 Tax=Fluviicola sp. TaxID=1917219 RepID=UPI002618CE7A|nr:T9SS type A sorting domain-containing protein [Fluviicola sp.]